MNTDVHPNTNVHLDTDVHLDTSLTLNASLALNAPTTVLTKPKSKSKVPVKNVHTAMFKEFRKILHTPTVYNQEEINALIHDQDNLETKVAP